MLENANQKLENKVTKKSISILSMLITSFLFVSIIPLILLIAVTYPSIKQGFDQSIEEELIEISTISKKSLEKWFDELTDSVTFESTTNTTQKFVSQLHQSYLLNNAPLNQYTRSKFWRSLSDEYHEYYTHFSSMHADFYDIFLIDIDGNILYTLAGESDLGTNLNTGIYSDTLFGKTFRQVMHTKQAKFSDLEYYAPSNNVVSGFIVSPIITSNNQTIGAFALQINFESAMQLYSNTQHSSMVNYIVNADRYLRSSVSDFENKDILKSKIYNEITSINFKEIEKELVAKRNYVGVNNRSVIGVVHSLDLLDVNWKFVYEINKEEAYDSIRNFKTTFYWLLILCLVMIALLSYLIGKKISRPIQQISNESKNRTSGKFNHIECENSATEINQLATNYNAMLDRQNNYETMLKHNQSMAIKSLLELENIKFAFDQHSIISITDIKGNIISVNDRFEKISGYTQLELIGQNHRMINSNYHSSDFWREFYICISKGNIWHGEIKNKAKDGHYYWVQSTIVPFKEGSGRVEQYIAIRTDITDQKQIQLELKQSKELAESAVIAKSEFLASMSHEIRTPMNGILGMLNIVKRTTLTDEQNHKIELALNSANGLLVIINDILDFSKIEAGKLDIEEIEFDLITLLGEVTESAATTIKNKDIKLLLDYSEVEQNLYIGDPGRIK
ncbi:histidine kinase dimerization/phospho-acceptor domain-containing protein [Marinicellulosiphila megalodicopiae]|uniref:histidine kinase dimerization/phospho-acceptor domain-containing protein n=1 Tax=Marinicellulosiphila megalodicopiae TaxID=2724896 RepID=UPI003BAEF817